MNVKCTTSRLGLGLALALRLAIYNLLKVYDFQNSYLEKFFIDFETVLTFQFIMAYAIP